MDQRDSATAHLSLQRQERSRGGESRSFFLRLNVRRHFEFNPSTLRAWIFLLHVRQELATALSSSELTVLTWHQLTLIFVVEFL